MESTRLATARKFMEHFATMDTALLRSVLSDTQFSHHFAPSSIGLPSSPSKAAYMAQHAAMREITPGFPMKVSEYIDSESSSCVVALATSDIAFREELKGEGIPAEEWTAKAEYIFLITLDETGEKVTKVVEFFDSKVVAEKVLVLMSKARENLERMK
jgi:hypothetical protein